MKRTVPHGHLGANEYYSVPKGVISLEAEFKSLTAKVAKKIREVRKENLRRVNFSGGGLRLSLVLSVRARDRLRSWTSNIPVRRAGVFPCERGTS